MEKIEILTKAAKAIEETTGVTLQYQNSSLKDKKADYLISVKMPNSEAAEIKYYVQVKRIISDTALSQVAIEVKLNSGRIAVVAEQISPNQAVKLRQLNISFFDTAGNAYFNEPGLYIFVTGNKTEVKTEKPIAVFNPNGVKLLLPFLLHPELINADYRKIEKETGVSRTTVGRIINDLERAGFMRRRSGGNRLIIRKSELMKRWVEAYAEKLRLKLSPVRYHSTKFSGRWWEDVDIAEYKAVWGGETGGAILTKHLKPQTATVYADSMLPKLQAKYGLVRDEKGEIEILKRFWTFGEVGDVAPPLVVYADLLATADERNLETAQIIYDRYLAQITEENS